MLGEAFALERLAGQRFQPLIRGLSPCQVNVGAMKQFVPYAKFLVRAYQVKHDPARHLETLPSQP